MALLLLTACGTDTPAIFSELDPRTADYADLRVFLDLPDGVAPQPGSPSLSLSADIEGVERLGTQVTLVPVTDPRGAAYRISPADLAQVQAIAARIRSSVTPGTGALAIGVEACKTGPTEDAPLEVALAVRPGSPPSPLIENALTLKTKDLPRC
jgi:hypothetical protein